jgi:putative transposase
VGFPAERPKGSPHAESRFTEPQIVSILREHDAGTTFVELGRKHGVHPNTVAARKSKYGDMDATELARSKAIDDEKERWSLVNQHAISYPERCDRPVRPIASLKKI